MGKVEEFWQSYLAACPATASEQAAGQKAYVAERLGDNPQLADELAQLILEGVKTATCSALWEWEAEGNPLICLWSASGFGWCIPSKKERPSSCPGASDSTASAERTARRPLCFTVSIGSFLLYAMFDSIKGGLGAVRDL